MFDIKIGTMVPIPHFPAMLPRLQTLGFESYELHMEPHDPALDYKRLADTILPGLEGRPISVVGIYGNTLENPDSEDSICAMIKTCIREVHHLGCSTIGVFAGAIPGRPMAEALPLFGKVFGELIEMAEAHGVRLAMEGCDMGGNAHRATINIATCGDMWERLFQVVDSPALGLEWEPAHALTQLIDPIPQLRKWAKKVYHVHGKDATIAWDVIRDHGIASGHSFMWDRTPGFGDTNWNDVLTILMQNGYRGTVDIEGYHDPVYYDDAEWSAQVRALAYLKDCRGGQTWIPPMAYNGWRNRNR